jgi:hypothetical protein
LVALGLKDGKDEQWPIEATIQVPFTLHTRVVSPSKTALTEFTLDCIGLAFSLQGHLTFAGLFLMRAFFFRIRFAAQLLAPSSQLKLSFKL